MEAPVLYAPGEDLALPEPVAPVDPEADPEFPIREANIAEYLATVTRIENQGGAWDPNLVETLASIGELQQQQGDYLAAIDTFDRALHVNRINNGLESVSQVALVQELIDSYLALQDWESADVYQNYLFYIQQKTFGPDDPRLIPALANLGNWHVRAFKRGIGEPLGLRLSSAILLFNAAARLLGEHFGSNDARSIPFQREIANSAFLIATNPGLMTEIDRVRFRLEQEIFRDMLQEDSAAMPGGFGAGERALREIIEIASAGGDVYALAEAHAHLGDWYLTAERRRSAEEQYTMAWDLLAAPSEVAEGQEQEAQDQEEQEEIPPTPQQQQLFSRATIVPTFVEHSRWLSRSSLDGRALNSLNWGEVDLTFTVTRNGSARQIEILGEEGEVIPGHVLRIIRELRSYRFRPQVVNGEMIDSRNNRARVRFWY